MDRTIGLWGTIVTLVGFVIGAAVFLLPGELAAIAGPGVVIAYAIASVVAAFSCVIAAQIGSVLPISGASFVFATKMTSPFFGFLMTWLIIAGVSTAMALLGHGFAEYLSLIIPEVNKTLVAVTVVILFGLINLFGAQATVRAQAIMVILFMTILVVFSVTGVATIDATLLTPFVPNGMGSVFSVAVPAFFSYAGFLVVVEIGGEIRKPHRTIPLALLISFLIVWLCYTAVSLAIVGHVPWQQLAGNSAPVATVAEIIFPAWAQTVVTFTILAAAATSMNSLLLGYSRDIYVLSRVRIFPSILSRTSRKHGTPYNSVVLLTALSVIAVLIGAKISQYATVIVLALMLAQILLGVSTLRLPRVMPEQLKKSEFRLSPFWRAFFSTGLILSSAIFVLIGVRGSPSSAQMLIIILLAGCAYYGIRKHLLNSREINMSHGVNDHIEESIGDSSDGVLREITDPLKG
ncbi:amino acid permease [Pseudomaricurvus alkylphenolicus]|uniref:APC family permease n=1 Tax=Pseudomaricurvus alkylphenolicus TaxID=1306991 RepID=UPI00142088DC|nr:APC family permease [Pseudomaricurvus alkylphenolicus]NIB38474.1 amino acid permease [Pseudomaricurvus alkylphenolicus]